MDTAINNNLGAGWSDFALLAFAAILFGALGALSSRERLRWFRRWTQRSAGGQARGHGAHQPAGFAASSRPRRSPMSFQFRARKKAVRLEALEIRRLDRELEPLGAAATDARKALVAYASPTSRKTNGRAWRFAPNSPSPRAEQDLDDVWRGVRATQAAIGPDQSYLRDTSA